MAVSLGARLGIVQIDVPVVLGSGFPQAAPVVVFSTSDAKVELFGTGSVSTTLAAAFGPRLSISIL
jgi:hypothetical protein